MDNTKKNNIMFFRACGFVSFRTFEQRKNEPSDPRNKLIMGELEYAIVAYEEH